MAFYVVKIKPFGTNKVRYRAKHPKHQVREARNGPRAEKRKQRYVRKLKKGLVKDNSEIKMSARSMYIIFLHILLIFLLFKTLYIVTESSDDEVFYPQKEGGWLQDKVAVLNSKMRSQGRLINEIQITYFAKQALF